MAKVYFCSQPLVMIWLQWVEVQNLSLATMLMCINILPIPVCVCVCVCVCACLSVCLSSFVSVSVAVCVCVRTCERAGVHVWLCWSICLSVCVGRQTHLEEDLGPERAILSLFCPALSEQGVICACSCPICSVYVSIFVVQSRGDAVYRVVCEIQEYLTAHTPYVHVRATSDPR